MPIQATVFIPPSGRQEVITVTEIDDRDAEFFTQHNVKLSMEQLQTGLYVIYGDWGKKTPDGEPEEAIVMSATRSCRELMHQLRTDLEEVLT